MYVFIIMQKKSVKKNRRRANHTRRMRGGNNHEKLIGLLTIIVALIFMLRKTGNTVPMTTVPVTTVPMTTVPVTTVPMTTVPASTVPATISSQKMQRMKKMQQNLGKKITGELMPGLTLTEKFDEIQNFLEVIVRYGHPHNLAQYSPIMSFCEDNDDLCKDLYKKYSFFDSYMRAYKNIDIDNSMAEKTCTKSHINEVMQSIIGEDNYVGKGETIDSVAGEIAFAAANKLGRKQKMTKPEIKIMENRIKDQMNKCGYNTNSNGVFSLNECCFDEIKKKGGATSTIEINNNGKIVDSTNVRGEEISNAIHNVEEITDFRNLTDEELKQKIKDLTEKYNIKISDNNSKIMF